MTVVAGLIELKEQTPYREFQKRVSEIGPSAHADSPHAFQQAKRALLRGDGMGERLIRGYCKTLLARLPPLSAVWYGRNS